MQESTEESDILLSLGGEAVTSGGGTPYGVNILSQYIERICIHIISIFTCVYVKAMMHFPPVTVIILFHIDPWRSYLLQILSRVISFQKARKWSMSYVKKDPRAGLEDLVLIKIIIVIDHSVFNLKNSSVHIVTQRKKR